MTSKISLWSSPRTDIPAGIVVFLVALPLCLGIALASGVPLISGLIAGAVGGLVVPLISRSPLAVAGPAAGLTAIVLTGIATLGDVRVFFAAVALSGLLQIGLGLVRAGGLAGLVPSSVIRGMLAAIGIILILKQAPHMVGHDEFDFDLIETGATFYTHLRVIVEAVEWGALLVGGLSIALLFSWSKTPLARITLLPPALVVVVLGTALNLLLVQMGSPHALGETHLVSLPKIDSLDSLLATLPFANLGALLRSDVFVVALTIAIVGSIETLLSLEAVDRIDPHKRHSPGDRELVAQGVGNLVSGLLGGLPLTSVIVRSSANVAAGAYERLSALVHGIFLVAAVLLLSPLLNQIPLACLAAILLQTGYKLASPSLFRQQWSKGLDQFFPFVATVVAVLSLDLLRGVALGIVLGALIVLYENNRNVFQLSREDKQVRLTFEKDGTFLTKPALRRAFDELEPGDQLVVDTAGVFLDHDAKETLHELADQAATRDIHTDLSDLDGVRTRAPTRALRQVSVAAKRLGRRVRVGRRKSGSP